MLLEKLWWSEKEKNKTPCMQQTFFYIYNMSTLKKASMITAWLLMMGAVETTDSQALQYKLVEKNSKELADTLKNSNVVKIPSVVYKMNTFEEMKLYFDSDLFKALSSQKDTLKKDSIDPYKNFDPDVTAPNNIPKEETSYVNQKDFFDQLAWWIAPKDPLGKVKQYNAVWNESYPALSEQEKKEFEKHLKRFTVRSPILSTKPVMKNVQYIALHSTGTTSPAVVDYLQKTGKVHFEIDEEGNVRTFLAPWRSELSQQNHLWEGNAPVSCASWMGDHQVTFKTIGVEVRTWPAKRRNEKQYAAVRKLLSYLMEKYKLQKRAAITHTMVAYNPSKWLMRKYDPYDLDREKLWLPPASDQLNTDIIDGRVAPNLISMYRWLRKETKGVDPGPSLTHYQAIEYLRKHYDWVDNSITLHKQRYGGKVSPRAHLATNKQAWLSIDEIDKSMITYVSPPVIEKRGTPKKISKSTVSRKKRK